MGGDKSVLEIRLEVMDKALDIARINKCYDKDDPKVKIEEVISNYNKLLATLYHGLSI